MCVLSCFLRGQYVSWQSCWANNWDQAFRPHGRKLHRHIGISSQWSQVAKNAICTQTRAHAKLCNVPKMDGYSVCSSKSTLSRPSVTLFLFHHHSCVIKLALMNLYFKPSARLSLEQIVWLTCVCVRTERLQSCAIRFLKYIYKVRLRLKSGFLQDKQSSRSSSEQARVLVCIVGLRCKTVWLLSSSRDTPHHSMCPANRSDSLYIIVNSPLSWPGKYVRVI